MSFSFEEESNGHFSDLAHAADEFEKIFSAAVQELMRHSAKTGVFLSGGLDSSMVAAKLAQLSSEPIHTFSIHFEEEYPNELEFARMVAQRYKTHHREICVTPKEFIPNLRKAIWHLDDPIGDPVTIPNFELAAAVSTEFEYIFNGEGGDPCFGGPKNLSMMLAHWYEGIERCKYFREKQYLMSYRRAYEEMKHLLTPEFLKEIDEEEYLYGILTPHFESDARLEPLAACPIHIKKVPPNRRDFIK